MSAPPDPDQVKARLLAAGPGLIATLLPGGRMTGREYRAKGPDGSTWAVVMSGAKAGHWLSGAADLRGRSFLSLIRDAATGGDHRAAFRWALDFLGDPSTPAPRVHAAPAAPPLKPPDPGVPTYLKAEPFAWSNPVGLYLQGRGLDPADFPWPPRSLRFHPSLWNAETQCFLPGMLGPIVDPASHTQIGLHRTYLGRFFQRRWGKAGLDSPKMVMGRMAGGLIPLTRGASRKPWAKAPDPDRLLLAEGIENALAVAGEEPDYRAAAYVSSPNLLRLVLPAQFRTVLLVCDRDGENWSVTEDRDLAIEQWRLEGRQVETWLPPPGCKDAADWLAEQRKVIP